MFQRILESAYVCRKKIRIPIWIEITVEFFKKFEYVIHIMTFRTKSLIKIFIYLLAWVETPELVN